MPLDAFALALAAAVVHALWNLLTARAGESHVAAGVALAVGTVAFAPVAALTWDVRAGAVPYIVASAALELAYLALLGTAYQRAPLTVVYPIARGTAPVIVLAISVLALGESLPAAAALGVLAVGGGVVLVRGTARGPRGGTLLGLAVAACIAGYTLVDNAGLDHAAPIPYLELVMIPTAQLGGDRARRARTGRGGAGGRGPRVERGDRDGARGRRAARARRRAALDGRGARRRGRRGDRARGLSRRAYSALCATTNSTAIAHSARIARKRRTCEPIRIAVTIRSTATHAEPIWPPIPRQALGGAGGCITAGGVFRWPQSGQRPERVTV